MTTIRDCKKLYSIRYRYKGRTYQTYMTGRNPEYVIKKLKMKNSWDLEIESLCFVKVVW